MKTNARITIEPRDNGMQFVTLESTSETGEAFTLQFLRRANPHLTVREVQRDLLEHARQVFAELLQDAP